MPKRAKKLCEFTGQASLSELRDSHILAKRPFVCRGFFSPNGSWADETLLELVGDVTVPVFYTEGDQSAFVDGRLFVQLIPFREMLDREDKGIESAGYVLAKHIEQSMPRLYDKLEVPDPVQGEQCNLWYSRRSNTTRLHYDRADNFVRLLRGKKTFTILPPHSAAHASPFWAKGNVNFSRLHEAPDFEKRGGYRVELEPGDLFFLPRNWWHHVVSSPGAAVNFWWDETPPTRWSELQQQRHHFLNRGLRKICQKVFKRSLSACIRSGTPPAVSHAKLHADGQTIEMPVMKLGVGVVYVRRDGKPLPDDGCEIEIPLPQTDSPVWCKGHVRPKGLDDDLAEILFDEISKDDTDRLVRLVSHVQRRCLPGEI